MNTKMFLNLPVKSLEVTTEFYRKLGFKFDPNYTDEKGTCMVISDDIYIMFLTESFFKSFTKKEIPNSNSMAQCIVALMVDSKEEVDKIVDQALAGGASQYDYDVDVSSMYVRSFNDPDGYLIEIFSA